MDRYIIIMEDNSIFTSTVITEDDMGACDEGYIDIIDTHTGTMYFNGEWTTIEKVAK